MANIGNLALLLSVNPTQFISGLQLAQEKLSSFSKQAFSSLSPLTSLSSPVAALGALSSLSSAINSSLSDISDRAKTADRLGVSMKDMAAIQIIAGSRSEQMTKALGHLNAEIGALRSGVPEAAKKFQELGLSADAFRGTDTSSALRLVMDKLHEMPNAADRAYLAQQLLKKGGLEVVDVMSKGSAALDQAGKKAEDLGLVTSRAMAQQAIEARKAMKEFDLMKKGFMEMVAIKAAPGLTKLMDELQQMRQASANGKPLDFLIPLFEGFKPLDHKALQAFAERADAGADATKQQDDFLKKADEIDKALIQEWEGMGRSANMHKILELATLADTESQKGFVNSLMKKADAVDADTERMKRETALMERAQKVMEDNLGPLQKFQIEMQHLAELEKMDAISKDDRAKATKRMAEALKDSLGLGTAPGVVTGQEAGSAAAQQTLAQAESRNAFNWADDLKQLMNFANQQRERLIQLQEEFNRKNQDVIAASF